MFEHYLAARQQSNIVKGNLHMKSILLFFQLPIVSLLAPKVQDSGSLQ
jgi:hypothetical protein